MGSQSTWPLVRRFGTVELSVREAFLTLHDYGTFSYYRTLTSSRNTSMKHGRNVCQSTELVNMNRKLKENVEIDRSPTKEHHQTTSESARDSVFALDLCFLPPPLVHDFLFSSTRMMSPTPFPRVLSATVPQNYPLRNARSAAVQRRVKTGYRPNSLHTTTPAFRAYEHPSARRE